MNYLKKNAFELTCLVAGLGLLAVPLHAQYTGPAAGQKVAFLGDSITNFGTGPGGYVALVAKALEQTGHKIEVIPAGVNGNTSNDMLARLDRAVLSKKPDWMTLSCGVNDVNRTDRGVPLEQYKQNITSIVDKATAAGIKVVILTATMIMEDQSNAGNQKLVAYNDFLRSLATEKHLLLADLNADMQAALAQEKTKSPNLKGVVLTVDGIHMNGQGNEVMAAGMLKAFGFTDAQLAQAKESWLDLPDGMTLTLKPSMTVRQYLQMREAATSQGHTVEEVLTEDLAKDVQNSVGATAKP